MSVGILFTVLVIFSTFVLLGCLAGSVIFIPKLWGKLIGFLVAIGIFSLMIHVSYKIEGLITKSYDNCQIIGTYELVPEGDERYFVPPNSSDMTTLSYIDENNDVRYIKCKDVKIKYDLEEGKPRYFDRIKYEHMIFTWEELVLHLRKE